MDGPFTHASPVDTAMRTMAYDRPTPSRLAPLACLLLYSSALKYGLARPALEGCGGERLPYTGRRRFPHL